MHTHRVVALVGALIVAQACTRTVYVPVANAPQTAPAPAPRPVPQPEPPRERPQPAPVTILGIPAGHLPDLGQCRLWIPGVAPARQRYRRSQSCQNIGNQAPVGSWVLYRPSQDPQLAHVRVTDRQRPGKIHVVHVFEAESGRFLGDETYDEPVAQAEPPRGLPRAIPPSAAPTVVPTSAPAEPRRQPQQAPSPTLDPGTNRTIPVPPPVAPRTDPPPAVAPESGPDRRKPTAAAAGVPIGDLTTPIPTFVPEATPTKPEPRSGPPAPTPTPAPTDAPAPAPAPTMAPLDIPPGHMPEPGECRIWIPGTPPGRQPHKASADCDRITSEAPAGTWVVFRPTMDRKAVHVRVVDARRAGVIVAVRVYDENGKFVREEQAAGR